MGQISNRWLGRKVLKEKYETGRLGARPQAWASNYAPSVRVKIYRQCKWNLYNFHTWARFKPLKVCWSHRGYQSLSRSQPTTSLGSGLQRSRQFHQSWLEWINSKYQLLQVSCLLVFSTGSQSFWCIQLIRTGPNPTRDSFLLIGGNSRERDLFTRILACL